MTLTTTLKAATTRARDLLDLQGMIDRLFAERWVALWLLDDF
ncbi:MAG: hypothetical protein WCI19_15830 [Betaproteobacteria bacterium]